MERANIEQAPSHRAEKTEKGFTLVEVMVAICILAVGLLAVASMQVGAVNSNADAIDLSEAAAIGERQMEALISMPYRFNITNDNQNPADLQDTDGNGFNGLLFPFPNANPTFDPNNLPGWIAANPPDRQIAVAGLKRNYTVYWNIATDNVIANTKTVHLMVTWTGDSADMGKIFSLRRIVPRIS